MHRLHRWGFAVGWTLLVCVATSASAQDAPATLPLKRVVLLNSGLAFFEHSGEVEGRQIIGLTVPSDGINDLLKSLVVQDISGGKVSAIQSDSPEPASEALRALKIDLSNNPTLGMLLHQLRGQRVELKHTDGARAFRGRIVGVERRAIAGTGVTLRDEDFVLVRVDEELFTVKISEIASTRFEDPAVDGDFQKALELLAEDRSDRSKQVRLVFDGAGKRTVRFGYVQPAPVWKMSYRLVLSDEKPPFLQGWAIIENTTEQDWNHVELALMGGRPVTFQMDLFSPLFTSRPMVETDASLPVRPRIYAQDLRSHDDPFLVESRRKAVVVGERARGEFGSGGSGGLGGGGGGFFGGSNGFMGMGGRTSEPKGKSEAQGEDVSAGVETAAQTEDAGEAFRFTLKDPISLPKHKSSLFPIVNQEIGGERVAIYSPGQHPEHPLAGLKLKNTTEIHLQPGPITVFDAGDYAGDARIADISPAAERLLSYALALDIEIATKSLPSKKQTTRLSIKSGGLILHQIESREQHYTIKNLGPHEYAILIERPLDKDWPEVTPKPSETTRSQHRFNVKAPAGKTTELVVTERRPATETQILKGLESARLAILIQESAEQSPAIAQALTQVIDLRTELSKAADSRRLVEKSLGDYTTEQTRIRDNLKAVGTDDKLRPIYLKKLGEAEAAIEKLVKDLAAARELESAAEKLLEDKLANMVVE
ncbi:MAG: hypothetical protein SFV23_09300 [Planctomycetaceae bacterium]|nr:hypothetical protein [Planctomycetaceae bacterium]